MSRFEVKPVLFLPSATSLTSGSDPERSSDKILTGPAELGRREFERERAPAHIDTDPHFLPSRLDSSIMIIFPPFDAPEKWRAVDDRIRGGSSTSHFEPIRHGKDGSGPEGVRFFGELGTFTGTQL